MKVEETIPAELQDDVAAALSWFNEREDTEFSVTGIVDPDAAIAERGQRSLRLVLCGGDRCEQHSFRVFSDNGLLTVSFLEEQAADNEEQKPARLDPPPGALRGWLDRTLAQREFTFLVFYRGFW